MEGLGLFVVNIAGYYAFGFDCNFLQRFKIPRGHVHPNLVNLCLREIAAGVSSQTHKSRALQVAQR